VRVVDGDTIVLDQNEKVRLIGVDTPETVHPAKPVEWYGKEASAFATRRLQGKMVQLAYNQQRRDRYRRTLAYVCLDGHDVNEEIIREGYGFAYVKYPFNAALMDRFRAAEASARTAGRGSWGRTNGGFR
jgi:micrococcal nuclease